jgi:hypothetical protein
VYKGDLKDGELLHKYAFPHGAEYRFSNQCLYIYDKNGKGICLYILDKLNDIWMEWLRTTRLISDFKREPAEDSKIYLIIYNLVPSDGFDEKTYSLKFNPPSFIEFGNVYNDKCMTLF